MLDLLWRMLNKISQRITNAFQIIARLPYFLAILYKLTLLPSLNMKGCNNIKRWLVYSGGQLSWGGLISSCRRRLFLLTSIYLAGDISDRYSTVLGTLRWTLRESFALILNIQQFMSSCLQRIIGMTSTGMPRKPYQQTIRLQEVMWYPHIVFWTQTIPATEIPGDPWPGS